jgi:hypothetical protein
VDLASGPMIELAWPIDADSRAVRIIMEKENELKQQAHANLAVARLAVEGTDNYPDAAFTLRLAFGEVAGYKDNGRHVPFQTNFAGLYERAEQQNHKPPFDLLPRWQPGCRP